MDELQFCTCSRTIDEWAVKGSDIVQYHTSQPHKAEINAIHWNHNSNNTLILYL